MARGDDWLTPFDDELPDDYQPGDSEYLSPDEWEDLSTEARIAMWAHDNQQWLPDDFFNTVSNYEGGADTIRNNPMGGVEDALEYLYGTGAFPYSFILYDEYDDVYYVAVDYEETT